jgi:hypothetical protein
MYVLIGALVAAGREDELERARAGLEARHDRNPEMGDVRVISAPLSAWTPARTSRRSARCARRRPGPGPGLPCHRAARPATYGRTVANLDDVARMALDLPEVTENERRGTRTWAVAGKTFAWERPFSKADIRRFGDETPPDGPILAVRVEDLGEKEAVLAANPGAFFTIPHFDGFSAVLIQVRDVADPALCDALADAWLACAPPKLADAYLRDR